MLPAESETPPHAAPADGCVVHQPSKTYPALANELVLPATVALAPLKNAFVSIGTDPDVCAFPLYVTEYVVGTVVVVVVSAAVVGVVLGGSGVGGVLLEGTEIGGAVFSDRVASPRSHTIPLRLPSRDLFTLKTAEFKVAFVLPFVFFDEATPFLYVFRSAVHDANVFGLFALAPDTCEVVPIARPITTKIPKPFLPTELNPSGSPQTPTSGPYGTRTMMTRRFLAWAACVFSVVTGSEAPAGTRANGPFAPARRSALITLAER